MFDSIREKLDYIIGCCDNITDTNLVESLTSIRANVAEIQLELEELEYQNSED